MNSDISTALVLLVVGMLTVFSVLAIIVISTKGLIHLLNSMNKDEMDPKPTRTQTTSQSIKLEEKNKLVAVLTAIEIITGGHGTVQEIEKI